jgi:2,3-bisphosphoglycerate-dependent phosphoglycerate mutase
MNPKESVVPKTGARESRPMQTTRFILIRHAETEANASKKVWQGASDTPLTMRGELQIAATAAHVTTLHRRYAIDVCYVSTLPRARHTADAISRTIGLPVQIDHALREFDLGDWEGRTWADLEDTENLSKRWDVNPHFAPPGGESPSMFQHRVLTVFESLASAHPHHTVLVVTHGGVIRNLLGLWIGNGPDDWQRWQACNCSVTILERRDQTWHPLLLNDTSHIPPEAVVITAASSQLPISST